MLSPILYSPMDCNSPRSSVHGILQARILEWVAIFSSRGSSPNPGVNLSLWQWQADSLPLSHLESFGPRHFDLKAFRESRWDEPALSDPYAHHPEASETPAPIAQQLFIPPQMQAVGVQWMPRMKGWILKLCSHHLVLGGGGRHPLATQRQRWAPKCSRQWPANGREESISSSKSLIHQSCDS